MAWPPACVSLSCLTCLACQRRLRAVCHNYSFWTFLFLFLWWNKKLNWVSSELNPYHCIWDTLKKIVHVLSCAGDHDYRVFILQSESWRIFHFVMWIFFDTSVVRTFASLIFWLALWTFAWLGELSRQHANTPTRQHANTPTRQHANTPTRRKIARKLGDISKKIEREIRSHYFCNTSH